ncbi:hypothetical protein BCAR13_370027 [Paraburkholderia caribensis]|nr:hypothetical protein BCAR13_370027 [Paraburkholderia caribensis]
MPPTYRHFFDVGYDRQILRRRFIRQYKKTPKVGIIRWGDATRVERPRQPHDASPMISKGK